MADAVLRAATPDDVPAIGRIWHAAWHDGHDGRVPEAVHALRTARSFHERAVALVPDSVVAERDGSVVGFAATGGDEVAELFVAREARGTEVARLLLRAAEQAVRRAGHRTACLGVVTGNDRARRFYEREGWTLYQGPHFFHAIGFDLVEYRLRRGEPVFPSDGPDG